MQLVSFQMYWPVIHGSTKRAVICWVLHTQCKVQIPERDRGKFCTISYSKQSDHHQHLIFELQNFDVNIGLGRLCEVR